MTDRATLLVQLRTIEAALAATEPARGPLVPDDAPLGPAWGLFGVPAQGTDRTRPGHKRAATDATVTIPDTETQTQGVSTMTKAYRSLIGLIECADGFTMSVQASEHHYCEPRTNFGPWASVEVGFPTAADELLAPYQDGSGEPTQSVYGWVPFDVVVAVIAKHGGRRAL